MGKHKHSKDRMFITYSEHKSDWGGKKDPQHIPIAKLPFFCCGLSLMPFQDAVCSQDGVIFDIVNIVPFIKKYKRNPVTGQPIKITDLVKLNFHKNDKGEFHDPISFKVFTEFTKIVAIRQSGNVYCYDTIDELNKKPKYYKDLLTNEAFTFRDIIVLQDPTNLEKRTVKDFYHIKDNLQINKNDNFDQTELINQTQTAKSILIQHSDQQKFKSLDAIKKKVKIEDKDPDSTNSWVKERLEKKDLQHSLYTINQVATSVTCSAVDVHSDNKLRSLNEMEIRSLYYSEIQKQKQKGYVTLVTNLGNFTLLLYCDLIPITCENFLELCEKKYYNNTKFHRLIKDFCLQGGDPTGTGSGGQSIFGKEFQNEYHTSLSHNKPGLISMANKGKDTNTSQFFLTLNECTHLDLKHTVFGEIIKGMNILEFVNDMEVDKKDKPINDIIIKDTIIVENPYRQFVRKFKTSQQEILNNKPKNNQVITEKNTQDIMKNIFKKEEIKSQSLAEQLLDDY